MVAGVLRNQFILIFFLMIIWAECLAQDTLALASSYLKTNDSVLVFTPKGYRKSQSYPSVVLLHGHSANYKSWSRLVDLQRLSDKYNFLIFCPDGLKKSWYMDSPHRDSIQYESFFIKEFLPYISGHYGVDSTKMFITGASMGGHGAMSLFLKHPDIFLSAGSTSGVLNLRYSGFKTSTLTYLLGSYSDENKLFDSYSAINLLKNIIGLNRQIIFDSGTEDYLYITSKKFREKCDELKIKATYIAQPGGHTGSYWSKSIVRHFEFFYSILTDRGSTK